MDETGSAESAAKKSGSEARGEQSGAGFGINGCTGAEAQEGLSEARGEQSGAVFGINGCAGAEAQEAARSPSAPKWRPVLLWALLVLALDLISKEAARRYFSPWEPLEIIPGLFNLVLAYNSGAAFSLLAGEPGRWQGLKMAFLALLSLLPFIYFYRQARASQRLSLIAIGLVLGGALGNIHDRLRWGAVVDFLDFYWRGYHWPAFNLADAAICTGVGLLVLSVFRAPSSGSA